MKLEEVEGVAVMVFWVVFARLQCTDFGGEALLGGFFQESLHGFAPTGTDHQHN